MNKFNNLENKRFGRWIVVKKTNERSSGSVVWLCRCDCGSIKKIRSSCLTHGETLSCGCLRTELFKNRITKHGMSSTLAYRAWWAMKSRCNNPKNRRYKDYGGRNIKICERWKVFENFHKDMGDKPSVKSLDRIDNNKGYEPSNCKWSTSIEQLNNTRRNSYITYKGITKTISEWARYLGIEYSVIHTRIRRGWTAEKIIEKRVGVYKNKITRNQFIS